MAVRKIVKIDVQKCDGCGQCIISCPEGALEIVDGKARVVKESYCDGLGACLGTCPMDAIIIEEREADDFDEEAVNRHVAEARKQEAALPVLDHGCPGSAMRRMERSSQGDSVSSGGGSPSQLSHWPIQLALVPPGAPFLREADLLLVADCVGFSMADFHDVLLRGRALVIGCPKLDDPQPYVDKLADIIQQSSIRSLSIVIMDVPCCRGLCQIAKMAMKTAGGNTPVKEITVSVDGRIVAERDWQE